MVFPMALRNGITTVDILHGLSGVGKDLVRTTVDMDVDDGGGSITHYIERFFNML